MRWAIFLLIFSILFAGCNDSRKKSYNRPSEFLLESLVIEVQPVNGRSLDGKEMERFKGEYQSHGICAIESITIVKRQSVRSDIKVWTNQDLYDLRSANQTLFDESPNDRYMTVFMAHVPGSFEVKGAIGLAFGRDFVAIAEGDLQNDYQSSVVMHEIGHALGLVDSVKRGTQKNFGHCTTSDCVMAPSVYPLMSFDGLCDKDLQEMIELGFPQAATACNCSDR